MKPRKWTTEQLIKFASESTSIRQILEKLGLKQAGGNYHQIKEYIKKYNINTSHFKGCGWSKGMRVTCRKPAPLETILIKNSNFQTYKLKQRLFKEKLKLKQCEECGWSKYSNDGRLPLELDHINGDSRDNRMENIRILCPNCHSLKPTHRGRNMKKYKHGSVAE